jgi:hypothetical protein
MDKVAAEGGGPFGGVRDGPAAVSDSGRDNSGLPTYQLLDSPVAATCQDCQFVTHQASPHTVPARATTVMVVRRIRGSARIEYLAGGGLPDLAADSTGSECSLPTAGRGSGEACRECLVDCRDAVGDVETFEDVLQMLAYRSLRYE